MTTLCLCDWVEPQADRERRLALAEANRWTERAPPASIDAAPWRTQEPHRLPMAQAATRAAHQQLARASQGHPSANALENGIASGKASTMATGATGEEQTS